MSLRRLIVELDPKTVVVTEFCATHRISTWFFYDLRRRYLADGEAVLEPRSRAPRKVANRISAEVEDLVVTKHKQLKDLGMHAGPASIASWFPGIGLPSEATMWRILKARGFVVSQPRKAPKTAGRRFVAERANELWQLDDTAWALADGSEVKIFNVIDDHSRLLVASVAMRTCSGAGALEAVLEAAAVLGLPERFLSDNAGAFRYVLADAMGELGVGHGHSRPHHPQTNGKVERFHQTDKLWLAGQSLAETLEELQAQLDTFRWIYNHQRPHRGIGRRRPAEVWAAAPKSGPRDRPLAKPTAVHRGTVGANGTFFVGHDMVISVGKAHSRGNATTVITGEECHVFIDGRLARRLTIDRTRRVQALHPRPGRPTVRDVPRQP